MAHSVGEQLAEILNDYEEEVREIAKKDIQKAAKDTAKDLRQTSPKKSGDYARSWSAKQQNGGWVVYNKEHYRLTHLLENGHVIRNQSGTYGRTQGEKHIEPAEQRASEALVKKIEEDLNR